MRLFSAICSSARWLVGFVLTASLCVPTGCASGRATTYDIVARESGVASYQVTVKRDVKQDVRALIDPAKGLLFGSGWTIGCPLEICGALTGWIDVAGFSVGRLSGGDYIAVKSDDGKTWSLRRGADVKVVSEGLVPEWMREDKEPRWAPSFRGYVLYSAIPVPEPEGVFLGVWKREGGTRPEYLAAIFRDKRGSKIILPKQTVELCILAIASAPVIAISAAGAHNGIFGYTFVLRLKDANYFHVLSYAMFPGSIQCKQPPVS